MIKKVLIAVVGLLLIAGATFAFYKLVFVKSPRFNKAGLKVETTYPAAKVYIDGTLSGETPFSSQNLTPGEITLAVDGKNGIFEDKITLEKNTFSLVNLKIAPVADFSSSQVLWLEKQSGGQSLSVLSSQIGVRVHIDSRDYGLAPLTVDDITPGNHEVILTKEGFEETKGTVNVLPNHRVNFKVSMAPIIIPQRTQNIAHNGSDLVSIQNFAPEKIPSNLIANPQSWARGLAFALETSPNPKVKFDFLFDYNGGIYDHQGFAATSIESLDLKEGVHFGYLPNSSENALTEAAEKALANFEKVAFGEIKPKIEISPTGVGFLRVRDQASTLGKELAQVDVGEQYTVIDEQDGWYQIEYQKGKKGWVHGDYTKEVKN